MYYDEYGNLMFDPAEHDQRLGAIEAHLRQAHAAAQHQATLEVHVRRHLATLADLRRRNRDVNPQMLIDLTLAAGHGNLEQTYAEVYGPDDLARAQAEGFQRGRQEGLGRGLMADPHPQRLVPPSAEMPTWDQAYVDSEVRNPAYEFFSDRATSTTPPEDSYRAKVAMMQW